jgi:putative NADH-flavin reductase
LDLVVFGATGRAGSAVVDRALERGHRLTTFVRSPEKLGAVAARVRVVVGDATEPAVVAEALEGHDAALGALGARMRESTELSDAMEVLIRVADGVGTCPLVTVSHVGVFLTKTAPEFAHLREEHLRVLDLLRASSLAWTAVAPPAIEDRPATGRYAVAIDARAPRWTISRPDLADAMLDALEMPEWVGHAVGVSEPLAEDTAS